MTKLSFSDTDRDALFELAAGVVLLGNIDFAATSDGSEVDAGAAPEDWLGRACGRLGLPVDAVSYLLTHRVVADAAAGHKADTIKIPLAPAAAAAQRDALARAVYGAIFARIVERVCKQLALPPKGGSAHVAGHKASPLPPPARRAAAPAPAAPPRPPFPSPRTPRTTGRVHRLPRHLWV